MIPKSRISPIGAKILSYLPAPNTAGQAVASPARKASPTTTSNPTNEGRYWYNQPIVRWDHVFSDRDKFNMLFSEFHGFEYRSTNTFPPPVATGNTDNNRTFTGLNLDETHVISPTAVLDIRANWFRFVQFTPSYTSQAQAISAASLGMTDMMQAPTVTSSVMPEYQHRRLYRHAVRFAAAISWSPYNSWQFTAQPDRDERQALVPLRRSKSITKPRATWLRAMPTARSPSAAITQQASGHTSSTTEAAINGVAALLLGMPTSGDHRQQRHLLHHAPLLWLVYAQDDWKVTNRLTLNIGLRYDVQLPYLERYNRRPRMFDINKVNPLSDQILAVWNADAAAYNATNPKYPYPAAPAAIYGVWQFAGQNGIPRRAQLHRLDQRGAAHRLCVSRERQDRDSRRLRHVLPVRSPATPTRRPASARLPTISQLSIR